MAASSYLRRVGENADVEALSTAVRNIVTGQGTEADISLVAQNKNAQTAVELLTDSNLEADEDGIEANLAQVSADRAVVDEVKKVTNGNNIQVKRVNAEAGLVRDEYTQTLDAEEMDKLDAIAKAFGVKVVFKDKVNAGRDDAAIQGSVVEIEKGTDRALEYLIGHEIMHRIKELSPSSFKNFANAVKVSRYNDYAKELETTERVYEEGEDYDEEAICNMAGKIALDSKLLEKFIEQNKHDKNILQAFIDVLKKIWNTVTKAEQRKINDAVYQLEKALGEGSKVAERLTKEGRTETRDSIDFEGQKNNTDVGVKSLLKSRTNDTTQFIEDYDGAIDSILTVSDETAKEFADKRVVVEVAKHTPDVILENVEGARDLEVIINFNKLYLAVRKEGVFEGHYHNLGTEITKKLPEFLEKPDAIIQLANGRLNLFSSVKTKKGNNGIVSVELNSTKDINGKYKDYNVVITMFSSNDNYTKNLISGDGVSVKYKREDLSQVNPQLYKWLAIINDKSSVDNIVTQKVDIVNDSIYNRESNNSSPTVKSSRKGADNFATERKQSKDRQVVFNELAQEQANEIQAKLKEALGENADLRKQLKEANRRAEHFKSQLHRTPELAPDMKALKVRAKEYLADYKGSEFDVNVLASRMADWRLEMFDIVLNSESDQERENRWKALREKIGVTCGEILSNSYYRNEDADTDYKRIADYVGKKSGVTIHITEELKAEIEYSFDSYLDFRKRFSKHVNFKLNDGTDVSSVYAELAQNIPEYFNESTTTAPADQLIQICEVLESLYLTQPLQMWGMLVDSVENFSAKCRQYKINPNESTKKAKNEAGKYLKRTVEAILVTQAAEAALRMFVHFLRGNHDKYEDEEGKWTWETALRGYGYDFVTSLFNIILFGSTFLEVVDSIRD